MIAIAALVGYLVALAVVALGVRYAAALVRNIAREEVLREHPELRP